MIGITAAPITEKQPLIPHAHNMWSLSRRASQPMPVAMGNPMRRASGATTATDKKQP